MGRAPCCDKANVKKGPWSPEEDAKLKSYIEQNGTGGNWISLPQKIGLKRCGKSCRLRWLNYLRPNIKHGGFSEEEDNIICSLYLSIGSRWSIIAAQLPGRTDNDIKNYWNTRLKKKLLGKQRKEQGRGGSNNSLKQGTRKAIAHGKSMVDTNTINQAPYWPELPVLAPIPYSSHEPRFNDHASIRKLLIKLGGKFSDEENQIQDGSHLQLPVMNSYELVPHPIEMISSSSTTSNGALNACTSPFSGLPMVSGNSNFPSGFDEMGYNNSPQRIDGMEFLYEDMVSSGMRNRSSTGESIDWGEMSNLGYPPIFSNYEGDLQQGMVQECGFDDLRYSGVH